MPDTPENQRAFGQPEAQKPGCGFPVAKLAGLFCWATGALVDLAIGPYRRSGVARETGRGGQSPILSLRPWR